MIYTERTTEYKQPVPAVEDAENLSSYVFPECISAGFRFCSEKRIEVRTELLITGDAYDNASLTAVSCAKADDGKQRKKDDNSSLILYFADDGEDVWNIARDYCTSVTQVRRENDLSDDIIHGKKMIMIPV